MKKILLSFALLLATFTFAACTIEALPRDQNTLRDLIADLAIPAVALDNIELPDMHNDVVIEWASDYPEVLSEMGVVVRPYYEDGDVTVTLTATFTYGATSLDKQFTVYVQALSEGLSDWLLFVEAFHAYTFPYNQVDGHLELPESLAGQPVQWTSNRPATVTHTGQVTQPLYFSGATSVRMTLVAERHVEGVNKVVWRDFNISVQPLDLEASLAVIPERLEVFLDDHFLMTGTEIDYDIPLPTTFQGFPIVWESSNIAALSPGGYVGLPIASVGAEVVTLTARAWYDDQEGELPLEVATFDFVITVLPRDTKVVSNVVTLPFTSIADEYIVEDGELDVYYVNGGSVPYVDIESFIFLIEGAIISQELEIIVENGVVTVRYTYVETEEDEENGEENGEEDDEAQLSVGENGEEEPEITIYELVLDFNENTVFVNRFGFFSAIAESTQTDFGQDLFVIDYVFNPSEGVTFDLGAYRMELVQHEDQYLVQFHLANLFFTGSMYDVYYNGDALIGVDTYQISALETIETLNDTTKRGLVPYDMLDATYHFLNFTFDHFFGLKIASEIETYYEFFEARRAGFMSGGASTHYTAMFRSAIDLDDLHTDLRHPGYFMDFNNFDGRLFWEYLEEAPRMMRFFEAFQLELPSHCNAPRVRYFANDTIALVRISGFDTETPDQFRDDLIAAQNRGAETVIVDVSCNTGGIIGTMLQTLGYMTDEPLPYHSVNAGDGATTTAYYGTDNEAFDFNWYLLTSPVTYSAANLFASMVRELGIAPLVGEQSSGGASSITTNFLPSGAIVIMSSPNVLADANYESIEFGVPVDIEVSAMQFGQFSNVLDAIAAYEASLPTLEAEVVSAVEYAYDPPYEYGEVVLEDAVFTGTYTPEELNVNRPMNDIARYLGALYRQEGSTVTAIEFAGVTYVWNDEGVLIGSNWEDSEGDTLVSAIVDAWLAEALPVVLTLSDGEHTLELTFVIVMAIE